MVNEVSKIAEVLVKMSDRIIISKIKRETHSSDMEIREMFQINERGRIIKIETFNKDYKLYENISRLGELQELIIFDNQKMKSLPGEVFLLKKLKKLWIVGCPLDSLPEIPISCPVEDLWIEDCSIQQIPGSFNNLKNLKKAIIRIDSKMSD